MLISRVYSQIRPNLTIGENHNGINTIELCISITNMYDRDYIMQSIEFQVIVLQFAEGIIEGDVTLEPMCLDPREFEVDPESISPTIDRNKLETLRSDSKDFEFFWQFIRNITLQPNQTLDLACIYNRNIDGECMELYAFVDCLGTQFTRFTNGFEIPQGDELCPKIDLSPCATIDAYPDSIELQCIINRDNELSVVWDEIEGVEKYEINIDSASWESSQHESSYTINNIVPGATYNIDIRATTPCDQIPYGKISCMIPEQSVQDDEVVFIPNAFSPNADGINDVFTIQAQEGIIVQTLRIFTRFGEEIYTTNQQVPSWDGTFNGTELNPQVLMCHVTVIYPDGEVGHITSDFSLIR